MKRLRLLAFLGSLILALWPQVDDAFLVRKLNPVLSPTIRKQITSNSGSRSSTRLFHETAKAKNDKKEDTRAELSSSNEEPVSLIGVVAPLHRIGPYTCLRLQFPDWNDPTTTDQQAPVFDFMIDTGANVNSVDARLVQKYQLAEFSMPIPQPTATPEDDSSVALSPSSLIGATTSIDASEHETPSMAGVLHMLGNCQLASLPPPHMTFLRNLVAASLPFASPVGAGILGLPFLWTFPAGVEFDWYGTDGDPPTIIFYYGKESPTEVAQMDKMVRVPLKALPGGLLTLEISINGIHMRALLDTGSPLTVLNERACELLGIEKDHSDAEFDMGVKIVGVDGSISQLRRLNETVSIQLLADNRDNPVELGNDHIWAGPLAGIELIRRLDDQMNKDEPAAVLGLDFLQKAYRMIIRAPSNEVWFEEHFPESFKSQQIQ